MTSGLSRSGFDVDLAFGQTKESDFVETLRDCKVECKADQKLRKTGNIAIEIRQGSIEKGRGRDSGLSVTTARFWAIEFDDDRWLLIRTSILKAVVRSVMKLKGTVMGGDGNRFELVLVPSSLLTGPSPDWVAELMANEPLFDELRRKAATT